MIRGSGRRIAAVVKRIARAERGAALPMMVAGLIPTIAALGSGIDYGRMYMVKSQLQAAVDAAALAGARSFSLDDGSPGSRTEQADAYFESNFPDEYLGTRNLDLDKDFSVSSGVNITKIDAAVDLPMSFMQLFGMPDRRIAAAATAQLQPRPLEVQVVLDNTGSLKTVMTDGRTRIAGLKDAATSFINVLYQGAEDRPELALGFNLYTVTTNVGDVLKRFGLNFGNGKIRRIPGFTHAVSLSDPSQSEQSMAERSWSTDYLGWKGCVMDDLNWSPDNVTPTILSTDLAVADTGAFDIRRTLPGEGGMPAITPFFIPPTFIPKTSPINDTQVATERADPASNYYRNSGSEASNNLFFPQSTDLDSLDSFIAVNTGPYMNYLYENYIGLNSQADETKHVVRWMDPICLATSNYDRDKCLTRFDPTKYTDKRPDYYRYHVRDDLLTTRIEAFLTPGWVIDPRRIPANNRALWKSATAYNIVANGAKTPHPTPNWQCPEAALEVKYGRKKTDYLNYIRDKNAAIYDANGTMHHIGLLWGYRLLVRDDVFTRTNPTNERARRALVFMTDGVTELGIDGFKDTTIADQSKAPTGARTFTAYGRLADLKIAATAGGLPGQAELRFKKTCEAIKREPNAPTIYIIAVALSNSGTRKMFQDCAPGRLYESANTAELKAAFDAIAVELVDLHLTR